MAWRGVHELVTRRWFAGHPLNDAGRRLPSAPEADRARLVVALADDGEGTRHGHFAPVLQRVS